MNEQDYPFEKPIEKQENQNKSTEQKSYDQDLSNRAKENDMERQEPLGEGIMKDSSDVKDKDPFENRLEPKDDSSIGEMIGENALAREFPNYDINQLDSDHQLQGTDWEGRRSDEFMTDSNHDVVGVAEIKTHTGEISTNALNDAYDQLVNSAEHFGVDQTAFVSVDENANVELYKFSLDDLKEMGEKGFRDYIRSNKV